MKQMTGQMNFHLLKDPLWIMAMACYGIHKCWQRVIPDFTWMDHYWNDIWMLPCALPMVLSLYGALGYRNPVSVPSGAEILWHGVLWGVMAEFLGPVFFARSVGDLWDLVAYGVGGIVLYVRWHHSESKLFTFAFRI